LLTLRVALIFLNGFCDAVANAPQGLIPAVRTSTSRSVLANAKAQLLMALQDEDVGAVLGKKGQTLTQIQQVRVSWWGQGSCRGGKRVLWG
jgi:predicted RNA-binding protein YlqC (UPF0109 family)